MLQKRNFTAWMLLASLIVMSVFVGSFTTSTTPTYADSNGLTLQIKRGVSSGAAGAIVYDITQNKLTNCIPLSIQGNFYTAPDITFNSSDTIQINTFMDTGCKNGSGIVFKNVMNQLSSISDPQQTIYIFVTT